MKFTVVSKHFFHQPIFSTLDLIKHGLVVFPTQLTQWVGKGHLHKLRNGLYLLADAAGQPGVEAIASALYQPSYISLEYALNHYELLPDVPQAITSITTKTTRAFANIKGRFTYQTMSKKLFFGYQKVDTDTSNNLFYYLAEPEKALLDYFYLNSAKIKTPMDLQELRLNQLWREIINQEKLQTYTKMFASPTINKIVQIFTQD